MPKRSTPTDERIPTLALSLTDVRAHFEAQLRAVMRAEDALLKCQKAADQIAFEASTSTLRNEIQNLFDNNRSIKAVIDQMDSDARALVFSATGTPVR